MRSSEPLGSCSPVCPLGVLSCACAVLGRFAPVHQCARSVRDLACAVSWDTWLLLVGVPARRVVLSVQCPGQLGSCSPVCPLGALPCRCGGVLSHLAPVHPCARSVRCVACAVSGASQLLFTGVLALRGVLRVRRPGSLGSCSPPCSLGVLCSVRGVLDHLAPVHRFARSVNSVACAVSSAIWLQFAVCTLGVLCCWCGVLGHLAPVHRCAHSLCSGVCFVYGVPGHLVPGHRCASSVCSVVCAVSSAIWLLFTGVLAQCFVLCVVCAVFRATRLPITRVRDRCAVLHVFRVAAGRAHAHPVSGFS